MRIFSDSSFKSDCYFWVGKKPCTPQLEGKTFGCVKCGSYKPIKGNVLIIEAGGLGSILRTTTVSKEIKRLNSDFLIQWLTNEKGVELLLGNVPSVDKVFVCNDEAIQILLAQKFDIVVNFESAPIFLSITSRLNANRKFGYKMGDFGKLLPTGKGSNLFLRLQTDDNFRKKINDKSMQQILLETAGIKWNKQTYDLVSNKPDDDWARGFYYENGIDVNKSSLNRVIGFNIGTSHKLRTKRWSPEHFHRLAQMVQEKYPEWKIVVLAGPEDISQYDSFSEINSLKSLNNLVFSGYNNPISKFISLVKQIPIIISADTFGMHVAIGLKRRVIALFGPQPFAEVELYDKGKKLKLDLNCMPCFKGEPEQCFNISHLACMQNLKPNYVFEELEKQIEVIISEVDL